MKSLRKVMSLMLAVMMVIGVMSPAIVSAEVSAGNRLAEVGIIVGLEDGTLGLEKGISRAELVVMITRSLGLTEDANGLANKETKFHDVKAGQWHTGFINLAVDMGWVNGDTEGNFRPEAPVQFREAITMLLGALGYNAQNLDGQWPTNFVNKAVELELTGGVDYSSAEEATRGDIAELINKAYDYENISFFETLRFNVEDVEEVVSEPVDADHELTETDVEEGQLPTPTVDAKEEGPIGIITAMASELALLESKATIKEVVTIGNVKYHVGTLEGKDIVLVQAGVGKSLSSAGTAILINEFNVSSIIFTGIAGAVKDEIKVLDMVISTDLLIHDYGQITDEGFVWNGKAGVDRETGLIPVDEDLMNLAFDAAVKIAGKDNAHKGRIVTGDQFVGSKEYVEKLNKEFNAFATEMEGASVGRVAFEFGVPVVVIRSMSDKADGVARESMDNFGQKAADMSANIVMELLKNIK